MKEELRKEIVRARDEGLSWAKVAKLIGCARSTCQRIYKEETEEKELVSIEKARVLKMVPNPRLMLIYFEHKEGIGRCVKKPNENHPAKSLVMVKKIDGEEDLYRKI